MFFHLNSDFFLSVGCCLLFDSAFYSIIGIIWNENILEGLVLNHLRCFGLRGTCREVPIAKRYTQAA